MNEYEHNRSKRKPHTPMWQGSWCGNYDEFCVVCGVDRKDHVSVEVGNK